MRYTAHDILKLYHVKLRIIESFVTFEEDWYFNTHQIDMIVGYLQSHYEGDMSDHISTDDFGITYDGHGGNIRFHIRPIGWVSKTVSLALRLLHDLDNAPHVVLFGED
jgi:hypothetical protein